MSSFFESFRAAMQNTSTKTNKNPQRIKAPDLKEWLEQENPPLVLDVRTPEEYRQAHIPGSVLLPLQQLPSKLKGLSDRAGEPIVLYCASGARSSQAARFLAKNGFQHVFDMGGIFSWPYEVVR